MCVCAFSSPYSDTLTRFPRASAPPSYSVWWPTGTLSLLMRYWRSLMTPLTLTATLTTSHVRPSSIPPSLRWFHFDKNILLFPDFPLIFFIHHCIQTSEPTEMKFSVMEVTAYIHMMLPRVRHPDCASIRSVFILGYMQCSVKAAQEERKIFCFCVWSAVVFSS